MSDVEIADNVLVAGPVREGQPHPPRLPLRCRTVQIAGNHLLWPVKDLYSITGVHVRDTRLDGTGTSGHQRQSQGRDRPP